MGASSDARDQHGRRAASSQSGDDAAVRLIVKENPHQAMVASSPLTDHDIEEPEQGDSVNQQSSDGVANSTVEPEAVYVRYASKSDASSSVQGRSPVKNRPFSHKTKH